MKNVLFVASECVPFIKTGGLADVIGSLPKYIDREEFDVRIMLPKYTCIDQKYKDQMVYKTHFYMNLAWRSQYVGVLEMEYEGIPVYFIDNEYYFSGLTPYGNIYEDIEKFAFFCKATGFATLMGQTTRGDTGLGVYYLALPKSGLLVRYFGVNTLNPDGSSTMEHGTAPDIVLPERAANSNDRISPLSACLQYIKELEQ